VVKFASNNVLLLILALEQYLPNEDKWKEINSDNTDIFVLDKTDFGLFIKIIFVNIRPLINKLEEFNHYNIGGLFRIAER